MERDKKRLKEPICSEGIITDPEPIQEYEFFVREGAGEIEAEPPEAQKAKGVKGKNGEESKSRIFFSSIDEADA
jgi:hypothetical protein